MKDDSVKCGHAILERLATLEADTKNIKKQDEDIKSSLASVSEAITKISTSSVVNATMLTQIQAELGGIKKKADFIPNTIIAAVLATLVTFAITTQTKIKAAPIKEPTAVVQDCGDNNDCKINEDIIKDDKG